MPSSTPYEVRLVNSAFVEERWDEISDLLGAAFSASTFLEAASTAERPAFPHAFQADIINLWSVNLLPAAVSAVAREGEGREVSKLHYVVGHLNAKDGFLQPLRLMPDTSGLSVEESGQVIFATQEVDVEVVPKPKRAEFFSLVTPVVVDGTISDFEVGVNSGDLIGTVIRLVTNVVHVPARRLPEGAQPKDEVEYCLAGLERETKPKKPVMGIF